MSQKTFTKQSLVNELRELKERGWIKNPRNYKNPGYLGNFVEELLGITENNLPLPNAAEWELKTQRIKTNSLLTLFHMEPSPHALSPVSHLLKNFGWPHKEAGKRYKADEMSFRQTLSYHSRTDRGFDLDIDEENRKIVVNFDFNSIKPLHADWKKSLSDQGNTTLSPPYMPYWGFDDVFHNAGVKLKNCFFIMVDEKKEEKARWIRLEKIYILANFHIEKLIDRIKSGDVYVDFDARTGHNHGTKFRIKPAFFPNLYERVEFF